MSRRVLFIHSAGSQEQDQGSSKLLRYLQDRLGQEYYLDHPLMPNPSDPTYSEWKKELQKYLETIEGEVILIGHSLGGSVLLKYLAEEEYSFAVQSIHLLAAPCWGGDSDWQNDQYLLESDAAEKLAQIKDIYLYHSVDDPIVPYAHAGYYLERLPVAILRNVETSDHYFGDGLAQLLKDIKGE